MLSAPEEATEGIDELVVDRACTQVVAFVLHDGHLGPFVLLDFVLFDRIEALLAAEAAQDEDVATTHRDGVCVPRLVHRAFVGDLVLLGEVESGVFLWWGTAASDQNLGGSQGNGSTALVELARAAVTQLLDRPLVLVDVVAQTDFRVDVVAEQINPWCLVLGPLANKKMVISPKILTLFMDGNLNSVSLMLP